MSARSGIGDHSTWERPFAPLDPVVTSAAEFLFEDLPVGWSDGAAEMQPVGLLVGEDPGPGGNPRLPLWPWPATRSGGRLHAWSGMPIGDYLTRLARVNLARKHIARWNHDRAVVVLGEWLRDLPVDARVVLCGARARDAYDGAGPALAIPWFEQWRHPSRIQADVVAIPHSSPRSDLYNDPGARERAGAALRWAARWGEYA